MSAFCYHRLSCRCNFAVIFQVIIFFYVYSVASLNMKNFTSATPLNCLQKALIFALNDFAEALVNRSSK